MHPTRLAHSVPMMTCQLLQQNTQPCKSAQAGASSTAAGQSCSSMQGRRAAQLRLLLGSSSAAVALPQLVRGLLLHDVGVAPQVLAHGGLPIRLSRGGASRALLAAVSAVSMSRRLTCFLRTRSAPKAAPTASIFYGSFTSRWSLQPPPLVPGVKALARQPPASRLADQPGAGFSARQPRG